MGNIVKHFSRILTCFYFKISWFLTLYWKNLLHLPPTLIRNFPWWVFTVITTKVFFTHSLAIFMIRYFLYLLKRAMLFLNQFAHSISNWGSGLQVASCSSTTATILLFITAWIIFSKWLCSILFKCICQAILTF